jgi:CHAT domain-containing protein/tetratricopeptide (TPR) repeat protein
LRQALRWLILGSGLVWLLLLNPRPEADRAYSRNHLRLLNSLGPARPIEARLSGGGPYRPFRGPLVPPSSKNQQRSSSSLSTRSRVTADSLPPPQWIPKEVVAAILAGGERESERAATLAVLSLLQGQTRRATKLFQEAHAKEPYDPRYLNDLAVILLSVSKSTGDLWLALEAVEMAQRSIELEPALPAQFNKALALEQLGLRARAVTAWQQYLDQDPRSEWAQEATDRLARLEQDTESQTVSETFDEVVAGPAIHIDNLSAMRSLGEQVLLTSWAEKTLARKTIEGEVALARVEEVTSLLSSGSGRLLAASAAEIRKAESTGDRERLFQLAKGHSSFGQAALKAREEKPEAALALLDVAIRNLQTAKSPFELRARTLRAWVIAETDWNDLRSLDVTARERGFLSILAETQRIMAYRTSLEGRLQAAIPAYENARRLFVEMGEQEAAAVTSIMLAELFEVLGNPGESSTEMSRALAAGNRVVDPWNQYSIYVVAASTASSRFSRAAVELRLEAAESCRDLTWRPLCAVDSWLWVASLMPDSSFAEAALQRAGDLLSRVPESDGKARTELDLAAARAHWQASESRSFSDWDQATESYGEVARGYMKRGLVVSAARIRAARARVFERLDRPEDAATEYKAGLEDFRHWDHDERFRSEDAGLRSPREVREVYEALLRIELDLAGDSPSKSAFLLSEEMRDRLAPRHSAEFWLPKPEDVDQLAAAIPPRTAVIEYAVIGELVVAWTLMDGHLDQVTLAPKRDLGQRIRSLVRQRALGTWKRSAGELFNELIAPVLEQLPPGVERLVLIPDSELHGVPFRSLWDSRSGRYLDEIFWVALAPSVRQLLRPSHGKVVPVSGKFSVLGLGFTEFLPSLGLKKLPHAAQEAAAVRNIYGSTSLDSCRAIDWDSFRHCAPEADVIHLATHASADAAMSEWNWLAFERETVSIDRLWRELPDLPRRPLVVLSACESVAAAGGEGLGGLARPFLANGSHAIVGTLWKIGDEDAAVHFGAFHREYEETRDPVEALRYARQSLHEWTQEPWLWGGVEVLIAGL